MNRHSQETVTTFAEVYSSAQVTAGQRNSAYNDNRLMIYVQGMKLYIPDDFQPDTLLRLLRVIRGL